MSGPLYSQGGATWVNYSIRKRFFFLNIDHIDYSASGNMYFPYSIDLSTGTAGGMARLKTEVNGPCFFFSVLAGIWFVL